MTGSVEPRDRIGRVVAGVVRQAVRDAGADGVRLLTTDGPEAELARQWCLAAVGPDRVGPTAAGERFLTAHAATKTSLLLLPAPAANLLPLGDIYASEVLALAGSWSPPDRVAELAAAAGGVVALDAALRRWAEGRWPLQEAVMGLPQGVADALQETLRGNRFSRWHCGLVPKLTTRTLGIDLWE